MPATANRTRHTRACRKMGVSGVINRRSPAPARDRGRYPTIGIDNNRRFDFRIGTRLQMDSTILFMPTVSIVVVQLNTSREEYPYPAPPGSSGKRHRAMLSSIAPCRSPVRPQPMRPWVLHRAPLNRLGSTRRDHPGRESPVAPLRIRYRPGFVVRARQNRKESHPMAVDRYF